MSIAIFLTKIIHKIKSIFLRKVTQKEHCAGSVYHVNVGTLRNKFLVMVSSEDDLLLNSVRHKDTFKNATSRKFKKDLIENQLAAKELYVAKFYIKVKKWV